MIAGVEVMCRIGLAVPGRFHARHYHPTALTGSFAAAAVAGTAPSAHRGPAGPRLRPLRQPGRRDHRVPGRRLLDQAPAPGLGRARGRDRGAAGARRVHRAGDGLRGRPRLLRGLRGRPRARAPGGAARDARREWELSAAHVQALPVRLDRASRTWTARCACASATACARSRSRRCAAGPRRGRSRACGSRSRPSRARRTATRPSSACRTCSPRSWSTAGPPWPTSPTRRPATRPSGASPAGSSTTSIATIDYPRHFIGHVAIRLADGTRLEERQDHPRGGPDFPMTREELDRQVPRQRAPRHPGGAGRARGGAGRRASPTRRAWAR